MPKKLHEALKKAAEKKFKSKRAKDRYVYGALENAKKKSKKK